MTLFHFGTKTFRFGELLSYHQIVCIFRWHPFDMMLIFLQISFYHWLLFLQWTWEHIQELEACQHKLSHYIRLMTNTILNGYTSNYRKNKLMILPIRKRWPCKKKNDITFQKKKKTETISCNFETSPFTYLHELSKNKM